MNAADQIIFAFGLFATVLLAAGLLLTVGSFRQINKHPENYTHNPFLPEIEKEDLAE